MNDSNRYVIVIYGLLAKDFKNLDALILDAIRETFKAENIKDDVINKYLQSSSAFRYTKTKNRTYVARMNKSIEPVHVFDELIDKDTMIQPRLSIRVSQILVGDGGGEYIQGNIELYKELERFSGQPPIQIEAVQLKVTLNIEHFEVWRKLIIPINVTFRELHEILQIAFKWENYHLHEFYIYDNERKNDAQIKWGSNHPAFHREGKKPILNIVSDEAAFESGDDDIPMKLDTALTLSDYMPQYKLFKYNYDFGDGWEHDITFEKLITDYDKSHAVCMDGEGATPPEDVGGEGGYLEFLKIIEDETHPEHQNMLNWGTKQGYQEFYIDVVNTMLEHHG